jgi:anhydro-N-acetylmuramic acid kinase
MNSELYIGVMAGTSLDGTDIVCTDLSKQPPKIIAHEHFTIDQEIKKAILDIYSNKQTTIYKLQTLNQNIGIYFANIINKFISNNNLNKDSINAIGCHGITVDHQPTANPPYSTQLGCGHQVAAKTGITCINDFRMRDIVLGGQGAPLAPIFHQAFFARDNEQVIVINIGGIANASILPANGCYFGFDTGPGNRLIDDWCVKYFNKPFDHNGEIAAQGKINIKLLNELLQDAYFKLPIPKSTGREYFNLEWLQNKISKQDYYYDKDINMLSTITALTAHSIATSIAPYLTDNREIIICGGGANNKFLLHLLKQLLIEQKIYVCEEKYNFNSDQIEALGFALLAKHNQCGITCHTSYNKNIILGVKYQLK